MATPPKPVRRRRWRWLAAALLLPLLALALWSATEHALLTAARALERASGGRLALSGVTGTLYGPLAVARVEYRDGGTQAAAESVTLDWSPLALLAATVRVDDFAARTLSVKVAGDGGAAPSPPASLRVPIRVELRDLRIDRLSVDAGAEPLEFAPVAGSATFGVTRHTLALRDLGTPWARVSGDAAIGAWAPFPLHGRARLRDLPTTALDGAELTLNGQLERVEIAVAPQAAWLAGNAVAVVAPFARAPLQALTAALTDVDLAALDPEWPSTRAALNARLADADGVLVGPVSLENALAGRIDAGRVPLSAARGNARFDGTRLRVEDLKVSLADAGDATGWAEAGPGGYAAELTTGGVRLDRLHGTLRPLAPAGKVTLASRDGAQHLDASLREGGYALELAARLQDARLEVQSARLSMPGGDISAQGQLALAGDYAFEAKGRLLNFDPGHFVELAAARLNGTVDASGVLRPAWRVDLAYRIADSTFAGAPASGDGRATLTAERIVVPAARFAVGPNRVRADGRFGAAGDRLNLELDAPDLARLGLGAGGALRASGWVGGTAADPAFVLEAAGRKLTLREGAAAERVALDARAPDGLGGSLTARVEAAGVLAGTRRLARIEAALEGSRARHGLRIEVDDPALAVGASARGGLTGEGGWTGSIETLEATRPYPARLDAPVALRWRAGRLETGGGVLVLAGGEIRFEPVVAGDGTLSTRGRIERVALAELLGPLQVGGPYRTDLVVSGGWDVQATGKLNGSLRLSRDSGDVVLKGSTPLPLEISELVLSAVARDDAIEATLRGRGGKLGELDAELWAMAERSGAAWIMAPDAPLAGRANFRIPNLAWAGPLINPEVGTGGSAAGRVAVGGTLRAPRLEGQITGEKLRVRYGAAGVRLTGGEMRIELAQDKVIFRRIAFQGGDGTLTATGGAVLVNGRPELTLEYTAEKLAAVRRDDQQLVVSGGGTVRSRDGALALTGAFTADSGLIELQREGAPRLSGDVVILTGGEQDEWAPTRLRLDVTLNLGDAFHVRGEGLDARMVGSIRVRMGEGDPRPRASGIVRVAEGRYTAFGQQLAIERGALLFDGPLDNPRLDILAIRRNQRVEAGIAITGTALSPRTALYSNPPVPDSQKLRWLVLGSGPSGISDAEFGLTGGSQILDETVSLGAQLTSAVYVSVGQSLRTAGTFVQATLELTDRLALQGRTGAENAVTLIYVWSFD
ncbi:MAG: translocation/assembly module TamB domain-containing protein [Pseudomonadota bacterium]